MPFNGTAGLNLDLRNVISSFTVGTDSHAVNKQYAYSFANGTGAGQATKLWSQLVVLLGTTNTYDLTALTGPQGTVSFTKVCGLVFVNRSPTDGNRILLGNAASNAWGPFLSSTATTLEVPASGVLVLISSLAQTTTNPWTVDATHKNLKIDSGAATITSDLIIWGY